MTIPPQPAEQQGREIARYDTHRCDYKDRDGQWVKYDDHVAVIADLRAKLTEIGGDPDGLATYIGKYQEQAKAAIERAEKAEAKLAAAERERDARFAVLIERNNEVNELNCQAAKLWAERDAMRAEVGRWRVAFAHCYSGLRLYRDDGELQDSSVRPFIDFKRDSIDEIERKLHERGVDALAATGGGVAGNAGQGETNHG